MLLCPPSLYGNSITAEKLCKLQCFSQKIYQTVAAGKSSKTALYWFYSITSEEGTL